MVKSIFSLALCSLMFMTACKQQEIPEEQVEFATTEVKVSDAEINESYSPSIRGQQDVEIYPQVSGTISQLRVQEGQKVQKGEVLFVIDQVPYLAAVQTANANVNAAQAEVETAKLLYDSKKILFAENVVSEFDLSTAKNSLAVAEAALEQAKAQLTDAKNSLSYTVGRRGRNIALPLGGAGRSLDAATTDDHIRQCPDVCLFLHDGKSNPLFHKPTRFA